MGRAKEMYYDQLQQKEDENLAKLLGITYDELCETEWHIETDESKDGLVYGYIVYFEDSSPKHILDKIDGLDKDNQVWLSPHDLEDDEYYDYEEQYEAIIANKFFYDSFQNEISNVRQLNDIQLESPELLIVLKRQLYITAIGTLETFLSETFINLTNENPEYFRNFVETYPNFKERKFQLNEIYGEYDKLQDTAKKEMLEVIYHNLAKVRNMYLSTFKIEFPDISELSKAVNTRHDLVHRNGKTKDGIDVKVNKEIVAELLNQILVFVEHISKSLNLKNG
ncbi:HEPN domain-containing protein [uncultured Chryseobacterium sp.]|uniref:HEPN domain-containing protein n=1 Tax=uncultured Chryseobacterium sp. TaxID=259322 RepID=UPI0025D4203F|nr:HEPN domain-containing protein [uncultured Chryseobacterium sp.]